MWYFKYNELCCLIGYSIEIKKKDLTDKDEDKIK